MNPALLTREYAERTSESKTSLDVLKLNIRKRDSGAYQSFFSEVLSVLDEISFGIPVFDDSFSGFSVSNRPLRPPPHTSLTYK